ncbi:MAG: hypothetical protein K2Z80_27965 [Xanthobacteraceae bacterium]|nr:hypothetical protein [Xanthobacteraceae bacterium]
MQKTISMTILAFALLSSAANAQDMTGAEVTALIKGKTAYLNLPGAGPRGTGAAVIFYADDNTAAAKFPNGTSPKGTWSIKGNEVCIAWADQPNNPCSTYVKAGDKINIMSGQPKQMRATIERLSPGNAEKL